MRGTLLFISTLVKIQPGFPRQKMPGISLVLIMILWLLASGNVTAQNQWDGDNSVGNFSYCNNWFSNTCPSTWNSDTDLKFEYRNSSSQTSTYFDLGGWRDVKSIIYSNTFGPSVPLDGDGNGFNFWYKIENLSGYSQTITVPLSGKGLTIELDPSSSDLTINNVIYNDYNRNYNVYGLNTKYLYLNGQLVGNSSVMLNINNYDKVVIGYNNGAGSFGGGANVYTGELWFKEGAAINGGTINVGSTANTAKVYISDGNGGTTIPNNLVVVAGSTSTIGGLNSTGTNTYSGSITLNDAVTLENFNGGTVDYTGNIQGSYPVSVSFGITQYSTTSKAYTGTTTITNGALLILNTPNALSTSNDIACQWGGVLEINADQSIHNLNVPSGCALQVDAGKTLTINGTWTGGGTIINNGTIVLVGPSAFPGSATTVSTMYSLTINRPGGVTLDQPMSLSGVLTFSSGILTTTATNLLWLTNNSNTAVVSPSTSGFISGPFQWTLASGTAYTFPVGKGGTYYPFSITPTGSSPVIQAESFNSNCSGTPLAALTSLSTTEYWSASIISGTLTNAVVGLTRQIPIGFMNAIGRSATSNGSYANLNGTVSGTSIINSGGTGSSLGYFVMGSTCASSTNFYSKSTGNLDLLSSWGTNTDGTGTQPCSFTSANAIFNIRNNATPTIGANWTVSGTGSKVVVGDGTNACTFTIPAAYSFSSVATDISNLGYVLNKNASVTTLGTCNVLNGGFYEHNVDAGNIPTATWNTGSSCIITGVVGNAPSGTIQSFHNFIWNCTSQSITYIFEANKPTIVNGKLSVLSTGLGGLVLGNTGTARSLSVGSMDITNGIFYVAGASASANIGLSISSDFNQSNGVFEIARSKSNSCTGSVTIGGSFYITGGNYRIMNNSDITGGSSASLTVTGDFIQSGGTFEISRSSNINTAASCIVGGSCTISGGTAYMMNNNDASGGSVGSMGVTGDVIVTGNSNATGGTLDLNGGNISSFQAGRLFLKGNLTVSAGSVSSGTLKYTQGLTGLSGSSGIYFYGTSSQTYTHSGGVVSTTSGGVGQRFYYKTTSGPSSLNETYCSTTSQNTINGVEGTPGAGYSRWPTSGTLINNLTINNSTGVTLSTPKTVNGTLALTSGVLTTTATNILSITNNLNTAITTPSASSFVSGPMTWTLVSGTPYTFPVGKGGTYYPFSITPTGTVPVIQVEAFNTGSGGTALPAFSSLSGTEYWQTSIISGAGTYTTGTVGLARQTSLGLFNAIGKSATKTGAYACLNGSVSTYSVTGSDVTGNSLGYFALGVKTITSTITTGTVSGSPFCAGASGISVPFTYTPAASYTGSTFTAQLSDATGSFTSPTNLQSVASNSSGSQSVSITIPSAQTPGTGYRIRVISDSPTVNGSDNGVDLTINGLPSPITVNPSSAIVCPGSIQRLSAGSSSKSTILSENFNGTTNNWTIINNSTGGTPLNSAWTLRPNLYNYSTYYWHSNDNSKFYMSNSDAQGSGGTTATILMSPSFSTIGYSAATTSFYMHYRRGGSGTVNLDISSDGTTWATLNTFSSAYGTTSGSDYYLTNYSISIPAAFLNKASVYIRIKYDTPWQFYLAIDNFSITGTLLSTSITWSPTTNLFTDPAATIAYTGTDSDTVYSKPTSDITYTATATTSGGCTSSATTTLTLGKVEVVANSTSTCYTTLKAAFDAINAGTHTGSITVKIHGSTTEIATALLNASGTGSSSYTDITIYPTSTGLSVSGALNAPLIDLSGASQVTFDGRVNAAGSSRDLIILNTSTGSSASTIRFINDASSNTVKYCKIRGASTDPNGGVVFFSTATSTGNGNDQNTISYNDISGDGLNRPVNAIYSLGYDFGQENSGNIVNNNNIFDFFNPVVNTTDKFSGISLGLYNTGWTISENSIYETTSFSPTTAAAYFGININNHGTGYVISGNYIGGSSEKCGGTMVKTNTADNEFNGIYLEIKDLSGSHGTGTISANRIQKITWSNSGDAFWNGIHVIQGVVTVGGTAKTDGNMIGDSTTTGSIAIISGTKDANINGIKLETTGSHSIQYNTVGSFTISTTSDQNGATFYGILKFGGSDTITATINNNLVGSISVDNSINLTSQCLGASNIQAVYGIYNLDVGTISIAGNRVSRITNHAASVVNSSRINGIYSSSGETTISNNTITRLSMSGSIQTGADASNIGINVPFTDAVTHIFGNTIDSCTNTHTTAATIVTGLFFNSTSSQGIIEKNFIHSLTSASTSASAMIQGININEGANLFQNNLINLNKATPGCAVYGLYISGATQNHVHHNTVYLAGNNNGTEDAALYITLTNAGDIINNIFDNARGGGGTHYSFQVNPGFSNSGTIDYNDYLGVTPSVASNTHGLYLNPQFPNPGGLALTDYIPADSTLTGTDLLVPDDIDGTARCVPTMGAQEFPIVPVARASATPNPICPGDTLFLTGIAPGATSWSWSGPAGFTSTLQNPAYLNFPNTGRGVYTLIATNGCGNSAPAHTAYVVSDTVAPTFSVPGAKSFCVMNIDTANYYDPTMDIKPDRPEYYLFETGDISLDLNSALFADNCCPVNSLTIHWQIDFKGGTPAPITGTGQPSTYAGSIPLPGDGNTFLNVVHTISYWLTDCNGNSTSHFPVNITIKPRPQVDKIPP